MNTVEIGRVYENYIKKLLIKEYKNVWIRDEIPIDIFKKCGINICTKDIGFDLLAETHNENFIFIQCKNFSETICINDLAGFYMFTAEYCYNTKFECVVYYSGKLSKHITDCSNGRIKYINIQYDNNINNIVQLSQLEPKIYQLEAYNKLKDCMRSTLKIPCGMGKTFISFLISATHDNIVLVSPLRANAEQILEQYKSYLGNNQYNCVLISTDGLRKNIKLANKNIISVTYDSIDVLITLVDKLKNTIFIIDEFHNLSDQNLNKDSDFGKILHNMQNKILFLSATPKHTDKLIFGDTVYEYSWQDAIKNKYICDQNIYFPVFDGTYKNILKSQLKKKILDTMYLQAYYILDQMTKNNHKKCILYTKSIEYSKSFVKALEFVNIHFKNTLKMYEMNAQTCGNTRKQILKEFSELNDYGIICNVRILDEGIDIPSCDSVYLLEPFLNDIRIIQRICRSNRLNKDIPDKVAGIYVWESNDDKIIKIKELLNKTFGYTDENDNKYKVISYKNSTDKNSTDKNSIDINNNNNTNDNIINNISSTIKLDSSKHTLANAMGTYMCKYCQSSFARQYNVVRHLNICSDKPNYENKLETDIKSLHVIIENNKNLIIKLKSAVIDLKAENKLYRILP
jgi:superfamily II DNA or RNA helicase